MFFAVIRRILETSRPYHQVRVRACTLVRSFCHSDSFVYLSWPKGSGWCTPASGIGVCGNTYQKFQGCVRNRPPCNRLNARAASSRKLRKLGWFGAFSSQVERTDVLNDLLD